VRVGAIECAVRHSRARQAGEEHPEEVIAMVREAIEFLTASQS
jgi:hypothetical protein